MIVKHINLLPWVKSILFCTVFTLGSISEHFKRKLMLVFRSLDKHSSLILSSGIKGTIGSSSQMSQCAESRFLSVTWYGIYPFNQPLLHSIYWATNMDQAKESKDLKITVSVRPAHKQWNSSSEGRKYVGCAMCYKAPFGRSCPTVCNSM